jgi:PAS domain S-box-containing protein
LGLRAPPASPAAGEDDEDTDPWAEAGGRGHAGGGRWLLACAGLAALALAGLLLLRPPDSGALLSAAALPAAIARVELVLASQAPGTAATLLAPLDEFDDQLARLQVELDAEALDVAGLPALHAAWARARARLVAADDRTAALAVLQPAAQQAADLLPRVREALDGRRTRIEWAWKAALGVLALALALAGTTLWRQRRQLRRSLRRASGDLGAGAWRDAVRHLRDDPLAAPSAFDALAHGMESALGESERRWQALADLSADWYWETDCEARFSWLSASAAQAMAPGLEAQALLGRRHDQIAAFRAPARGWTTLHGWMAREEAFRDLEFQVQGTQGLRWIAICGRPRRDAHGRVLGYEGVGRDITERRIAHERLIASEQRWSTMTRLAADWYWQTDEQHRLLPPSAEQQQRIGSGLAERLEGRTRWDAHRDALTPAQWAEHRADLDARRPFRALQLQIDAGDGRLLWLSLSGVPRFDAAGRFLGYHGVGRDITARQQAERLLMRHNEELKRAVEQRTAELQQVNHDLEAFARQLAHELRTPIGHVQGLASLLRERAGARLHDDERELLLLQIQAARRMAETVGVLLEMARSSLLPMPLQPVDCSALAHEVIDELAPQPRRAPVQWHVQPGLRVLGHRPALKIALRNLLGNAAKFTREVQAPVVHVSGEALGDGRLRIAIADNGSGFDPRRAGQLFRPFGQLHARGEGVGLGLSIVLRIVERHRGSVSADGTPGAGARFELTLLSAPATDAPAALESPRQDAPAGA